MKNSDMREKINFFLRMKGYFEDFFFECHFQLISLHFVLCDVEKDARIRAVSCEGLEGIGTVSQKTM